MNPLIGPWSYSRATACARALYMEKVLHAPPEPRPERFLTIDRRDFGSVLHVGAEALLRGLMKDGRWPSPATIATQCVNREEGGLRPFFHLSPVIGEIERRLTMFVERFRNEDGEGSEYVRQSMLGSELKLAVDAAGKKCDFDKCPGDGWRGIIDYAEVVDDQLTIIDFKNRPAMFSPDELRDDEQLSGYIHLVRAWHGVEFQSLRYGIYYLEFGHTQLIDVDAQAIGVNVARLQARARHKASLTREQIGAEPGFGKCQYCNYLSTCDAGKAYMTGGLLAPTDAAQALETARWLMVHKELVGAAQDGLKVYTAEHGPLALDDKTQVGYNISLDGESYDKELTLRVLKKLIDDKVITGPLGEYVNLNTTAVKQLAKKGEVYEALTPARSPKADMKFDFFRPRTHEGVRAVKDGRKMVAHPDDERKTRARVRAGGRS